LIAPPGSTSDHVESLDVKSLRIPPATVSTLHRLGVQQISQLLALPRSGLATRLGETLIRRLSELMGEIETPLQVHRAKAEDVHSLELEYPSGDEKILADRIERLVEKVRAGLATRKRGALRITCRLVISDLPPLTVEVGLFAPTLDVDHLTRLLVSAIEAKSLPAPVTHITVEVTLSGPLRSSQTPLFGRESSQSTNARDDGWMRNPSAARLIDALGGRLGRDSVVGVAVNDNPLPEKAIAVFPLTGNQALHKQKKGRRQEHFRSKKSLTGNVSRQMQENEFWFHRKSSFMPRRENPMRRPLILLTTPQEITALPVLPSRRELTSNELPGAFRRSGKIHRIARHWGPERIETDWWQGDSIRRDYYRVETDQGHWWWIFRCLGRQPNCWMLHGYF
jgi:protein ImuB